jgi:hypothetical protein
MLFNFSDSDPNPASFTTSAESGRTSRRFCSAHQKETGMRQNHIFHFILFLLTSMMTLNYDESLY